MSSTSTAPQAEFVIHDLLPSREVHLLAGPSGAGKTTLLFQLLLEPLRKGLPIFNKPVTPQSICYIACDRSIASIRRTLKRVGLTTPFPYISLHKNKLIRSVYAIIKEARLQNPTCNLLAIDGFAALTPEGRINDYKVVADFLADCASLCDQHNLTIIGLVHAPKSKEGERYLNPRQRIAGTVAWAAFSDTVILIEPEEEGDTRCVQILPRNSEELTFNYEFKEGVLKETSPDGLVYEQLDAHILPMFEPGKILTRLEIMERVSQCGIKASLKTVERWLGAKVQVGVLEKPSRGKYRRIRPS